MNDPAAGGGEDYDAALPGAPTELAPSADETAAHTAWALDDGPEWKPPFWTAGRITGAAVVAAVVATVVVAGLAGYHMRSTSPVASSSTNASAPPVTTSTTVPPMTSAPLPPPPTTVTVTADPTTAQTVAVPIPTTPANQFPSAAEMAGFDRLLIVNLQRRGWTIYDAPTLAIRAHEACGVLRHGYTPSEAAVELASFGESFPGQAREFIATVMATYPLCP